MQLLAIIQNLTWSTDIVMLTVQSLSKELRQKEQKRGYEVVGDDTFWTTLTKTPITNNHSYWITGNPKCNRHVVYCSVCRTKMMDFRRAKGGGFKPKSVLNLLYCSLK